MDSDPYRLLGVSPTADGDALRRAYFALARRWHPDVTDDPAATGRMQEINSAYELLSDPTRRATYDRQTRPHRSKRDARKQPARPTRPPQPRAEPAVSRVDVPGDGGTRLVQVTIHNDGGPAADITVLPERMGTVHLIGAEVLSGRQMLLTFEVACETGDPNVVTDFTPPPGAWREAIFRVAFDGHAVWITIAARDVSVNAVA